MIRRTRRPGMVTRVSMALVVTVWSIVASAATADPVAPPSFSAPASAHDGVAATEREDAAVAAELDAAMAKAREAQLAWPALFREDPILAVSRPKFDRRLLGFDAFERDAFKCVPDPRARLACVHAYLAYVKALEKLVQGPRRSVLEDMAAQAQAFQRHDPETVEHFCGELRAREEDVVRRWRATERAFVSALRPYLGLPGDEVIERWEYDWALRETDFNPLSPPARIDLEALLAPVPTGADDLEIAAACAKALRAYRREMIRLLQPRFDRLWDSTCAFKRCPVRFEGETMFLLDDPGGASAAARARTAEFHRLCFEALRDAVDAVTEAAGEERGNTLRTRFEALAAPPVHPDPTDLAAFEERLRASLGDSFDAHEDLRQLFKQTDARRRALCGRMAAAYLQYCWDMARTGADTEWVKYCDELLARGRDRITLARQTVGVVRNRFLQTPDEDAVTAMCDTRDAELAAPKPLTPYKGMQATLDLASPDDAATQLLRQIEAQRREWEERRAKQAETEAATQRARTQRPGAK